MASPPFPMSCASKMASPPFSGGARTSKRASLPCPVVRAPSRGRRLRFPGEEQEEEEGWDYLDTVPPDRVPMELPALFDRVIDDFYQQMSGQKRDRIGLGIDHPALNTPIRIPFRRFENLHGLDTLHAVEKVQQSNKALNIDATMVVTLVHVADPDRLGSGSGAPRLKNVIGLEAFLTRKQCIVRIKNEDQSCLARALVVAQHYAQKPHPLTQEWSTQRVRLMRTDHADVQDIRARDLRLLGLPEGPCQGLDDLARMGLALAHLNYQLKVYSQEVDERLLYKCDEAPPHATVLHLYHHDQHYDVITSMPALYRSIHYCERCDQQNEEEEEEQEEEGEEEQHHLRDDVQYVFYDFECMQDTGEHIPNLCVVQLGCGRCISEEEEALVEEVEVEGEEVKTKKPKNTTTTTSVQKEDRIYVIAHNARSYDLHLILKGLSPLLVTLPTKIRNGQQILQVTLGRLCFEDSLNFIPYPLKAFPKSFGLKELKKGYFPHFFNTGANQTYRGPYPPAVMYDPDGMSPAERTAFLQWHTQKVQEGALFDLQGELLVYCQSDVDILRWGCADFRQNAINSVVMDPFVEVMTAAAFTMKSIRKHDLKPNTIAILPPQGYQPKRNYSQACMHWLHYLMETDPHLHLQHHRNGGEKEFTCGEGQHRYNVDGYDLATGTIYEFLGCFWHGCQACHKTQCGELHPVLGTSLGARYTDTHYRLSLLSQHPEVKRIVTLWEHEFTKMQRVDSALRAFLQGPHCIHVPGPLNPHDAFY
ncbi:uncharacterized protein [Haliotis cracherodii]|uniref:uncharacterized protein n=1 Tax=Haliotis cracherodii TaxID=6455 RepID=UPI0039EAB4D7